MSKTTTKNNVTTNNKTTSTVVTDNKVIITTENVTTNKQPVEKTTIEKDTTKKATGRPKQAKTKQVEKTTDKKTTTKKLKDTTDKTLLNNNLFKLYSIQVDNKKNDTCYSKISWEKFKTNNSVDITQSAKTSAKGCQLNAIDKDIKQLINLYTYINNNRLNDTKVYTNKINNLKKNHKSNYNKDTNTFNVEKYQSEYIRLQTDKSTVVTKYNAILDIVLLLLPTNYTQYKDYTKECNDTNLLNYRKSLALVLNSIGIIPNDTIIDNMIFYINHKINTNKIYTVTDTGKRTKYISTSKIKNYQVNILYAISEILLQNDIINIEYTFNEKYIAKINNNDILDLYNTCNDLIKKAKNENKRKTI